MKYPFYKLNNFLKILRIIQGQDSSNNILSKCLSRNDPVVIFSLLNKDIYAF